MKFVTYPIIPFTICFAIGIAIGFYNKISVENSLLFLVISSLLLGFGFVISKKQWLPSVYFGISVYIMAFCLGISTYSFQKQSNSNDLNNYVNTAKKSVIIGVVEERLKASSKFKKYIISVQTIDGNNALGKILVYQEKSKATLLTIGNEVLFYSSIQNIASNNNPYQFNYAAYLQQKDIYHQLFCNQNSLRVLKQHYNWNYFLYTVRQKLASSFDIHDFNNQTYSIINTLLLGQRNLIAPQTKLNFTNAGVIHILAISGLHIGILYFILVLILKPLQKLLKGNVIRYSIIILVLWFFAFITGMSPSVTRAVTMFSVLAVGKLLNRNNYTLNSIAFSALLLLTISPKLLFNIGFQLSYAAVLAIVLFHPFYHYFYFNFNKNLIVKWFIDLCLVSLSAQIGVLPLSLYYFNQFSFLFLVANIVVIPLTFVVLPTGMITLFFNFTFPKIALLSGKLLSEVIDFIIYYTYLIAHMEQFTLKHISFNLLLCTSLYIVIGFFIYWCYSRSVKRLIWFLSSFILFQLTLIYSKSKQINTNELIVFNTKKTLITQKENDTVLAFTNFFEENKNNLIHYQKGMFKPTVKLEALRNVFSIANKTILVIDSLSVYPKNNSFDVVVLTQKPRINLERMIMGLRPQVIIADNSNSFYLISTWKQTCYKRKIPFHATTEKGFYCVSK